MDEIDFKILAIYLIIICLVFIGITIIFLMVGGESTSSSAQLTYDKCCNGNMCSDTYYSEKDNLCHLSLCEIPYRPNKKYCVYEPND